MSNSANVNYTVTPPNDVEEPIGITIQDGPFAGVLFNFGKITFMGENEAGEGVVNFDYAILQSPREIADEDVQPLEMTLGAILNDILTNMAERAETETGATQVTDEVQVSE